MDVVVEGDGISEELSREWDALGERLRTPPFCRPGWIGSWWRAFGKGHLEVVTVRERGQLVGVAPLQRRHGTLRSPTNWHTPQFGFLAERAEVARALSRAVVGGLPRRVELSFVDEQDQFSSLLLDEAGIAGYRLIVRSRLRSPYVPMEGGWEAYEQGLDRKLVSELRRRRRRLEEEGRVTFEVSGGAERLSELLEEGLRVEASGWKGQERSAITSQLESRRFYREVAEWAAHIGWLRLAFLRLDGRPLGFDYALEYGDRHYLLKTGFDPHYAKFAPGKLMRHAMLARCFSLGMSSYEFLGDADPWKLEWTHCNRQRLHLQAFAPSFPGRAECIVFTRVRPLVKRVIDRVGRRTRELAGRSLIQRPARRGSRAAHRRGARS